jgi:hypothetical protein
MRLREGRELVPGNVHECGMRNSDRLVSTVRVSGRVQSEPGAVATGAFLSVPPAVAGGQAPTHPLTRTVLTRSSAHLIRVIRANPWQKI